MCSRVSLKVKGVVKALLADGTRISLNLAVTFHVSIKDTLFGEGLVADHTFEHVA